MVNIWNSIIYIYRAIVHIFEGKEADEDRDTKYSVKVSYVEIYNEEIRDLLSKTPTRKLEIKGNNAQIQGKNKDIILNEKMWSYKGQKIKILF